MKLCRLFYHAQHHSGRFLFFTKVFCPDVIKKQTVKIKDLYSSLYFDCFSGFIGNPSETEVNKRIVRGIDQIQYTDIKQC